MLMAVATVLFVSCNKITENKLIGKWNVELFRSVINGNYRDAEDLTDELDQMIFHDDGTYILTGKDGSVYSYGKWVFYKNADQVKFMDRMWDIISSSPHKEISFYGDARIYDEDGYDIVETKIRLRKAN